MTAEQYDRSIREEQRLYEQMVDGTLTLITFDANAFARASYRALKELRQRNADLTGTVRAFQILGV